MSQLARVLGLLVFAVSLSFAAVGHAEEALSGETVQVQQCPHCGYTVAAKCPMCDVTMENKTMTAADAQAALDKAKDIMRRRT